MIIRAAFCPTGKPYAIFRRTLIRENAFSYFITYYGIFQYEKFQVQSRVIHCAFYTIICCVTCCAIYCVNYYVIYYVVCCVNCCVTCCLSVALSVRYLLRYLLLICYVIYSVICFAFHNSIGYVICHVFL